MKITLYTNLSNVNIYDKKYANHIIQQRGVFAIYSICLIL